LAKIRILNGKSCLFYEQLWNPVFFMHRSLPFRLSDVTFKRIKNKLYDIMKSDTMIGTE
jgi:hypothetical protein